MSDTKPELKVRSEGGQVVLRLGTDANHYWDIPLSNDDAINLSSTIYAIAVGNEAVQIKEERENGLAAIIKNISITIEAMRQGLEVSKETKPETWRDRESML